MFIFGNCFTFVTRKKYILTMNSKLVISRPLTYLSRDHCGLTVESWFVYFRLLIAAATGCLTIAPAIVMLQVQQQPPGQSAKRYRTGPCEDMLPTFSLLLKIVLSFLVPDLLMYTPNTHTHHTHTHHTTHTHTHTHTYTRTHAHTLWQPCSRSPIFWPPSYLLTQWFSNLLCIKSTWVVCVKTDCWPLEFLIQQI